MFGKLSLFATFVAPLVSALILQTPTNPTSGGQMTIMWTSENGDPSTWSFELLNPDFHDSFAIANNVDPSPQQLTLTIPIVPVGGGYSLEAVNIGNISDIYATTPSFSIGATSSSSLSSGASTATTPVSSATSLTFTTTTSSSSTLIVTPSNSPNSNPSSTTGTSSIPTASSFSAASRQFDFKYGGMAAAVFAIGGAAILAL